MKRPEKKKPIDEILKEFKLTMEQELFCKYYTSPTEFFGNGVQSYGQAFNIDLSTVSGYNSAKAMAWKLLQKEHIVKRINFLLKTDGLNDVNVDKQLSFLLTQNADFKVKLGAIKEYNKLKQRITDKVEHTGIPPVTTINILSAEDDFEDDEENERGEENQLESDEETTPSSEIS